MNSSISSFYENVSYTENFSESTVYRTLNDLLNLNVNMKFFCPLCTNSFEDKFSLLRHLQLAHNNFVIQANNQTLKFKECPFCSAKFFGKFLTAKHGLLYHTKVVRELFMDKNILGKCLFCNTKLSRKHYDRMIRHILDNHFLEYEEEFKKTFSFDEILEMSMSELINSTLEDNSPSDKTDKCEVTNNQSGILHHLNTSEVEDFDEASKMNCFNFTDLKEQLEKIEGSQSNLKPILKNITNITPSATPQKSVRRVLRFDVPSSDEEDKENSVLKQNIQTSKKINIDEHSLLCHNNKNEIDKFFKISGSSDDLCEPQHSSTPNYALLKETNAKVKTVSSNFKSYLKQNDTVDFEYQCGKCRKLFKENLDLVCHVKSNHKRLTSKVLQPCYRCAICNARFYKNYYLKKHHSLHKPY